MQHVCQLVMFGYIAIVFGNSVISSFTKEKTPQNTIITLAVTIVVYGAVVCVMYGGGCFSEILP